MLKIFFLFLLCICSILASAPWLNEDKPNSTLTEGDIAIEDAPDSNEQTSAIEDHQVHASASSPWNRKWVNNIVPYTITRDFTTDQRATILAAMLDIQEKTCVSFVGREQQTDFILFRKVPDGSLCSSLLGREGGRQHVNLTDKCVVRDTVLHELMHVLGFQHEHTRHDRDKYIKINLSHVKSLYKQHVAPKRKVDPMDLLIPYDHKSITHYPEDAFSKHFNRKTIISKIRGVKVKFDGLSEIDVWKIKYMYNCLDSEEDHQDVENSLEHREETIRSVSNIATTTVTQQKRYEDNTNTNHRTTIQQLPTIQSTIKQAQTTIAEASIGSTLKMTTSTTTRPISILNKEIIEAVEEGNEVTVRKLLNEGAAINARKTDGEYENKALLHIASERGHVNVVAILLDKGANIEARTTDNWTPLHDAARGGHVNVVSLLLDKGANIEARTSDNWTPLHHAAWYGYENVVSLLLDKDANIEARTSDNWTPLHHAAWYGHVNVVSFLLDKGANIEARTTSNWTSLHHAAWYGHVNVVSLLLDKDANIEARTTSNWTSLHHAAQGGHVNVVSLLLNKAANIEAKDVDDWTPLHCAASGGHVNVVLLLLDKGANILAKGHFFQQDETPLDLAKRSNKTVIVEILERKQRQLRTG